MAVATVVNQVEAYYGAITGIGTTHVKQGRPFSMGQSPALDMQQFPLVILTAPVGFRYDRRGMGTGGRGFIRYGVTATAYLGPPEMAQEDAVAKAIELADRIRLKFEADHTLGGVCFNCETGDPVDNLQGYRDPVGQIATEAPAIQYTHWITEERTPAQAAA